MMLDTLRIAFLPESDWLPEQVRESMPRLAYEADQGNEEEKLRAYELFSRIERRASQECSQAVSVFHDEALSPDARATAARRWIAWLLVLADLPFSTAIIRNFYLREIIEISKRIEEWGQLESNDVAMRWTTLAQLGLLDHAQSFLDRPESRRVLDPALLVFLEAELRYRRRHFLDIPGILADYPRDTPLDARQRVRLFWEGDRE